MFCNKCGASVPLNQGFCGQCGAQIQGNYTVAYLAPNRVESHIRLLGILWVAISALSLVAAVVLFVLGNAFFPHLQAIANDPNVPVTFLCTLMNVLGFVVLIKAGLSCATGVGLIRREPWARMLALVMSFLALLSVPFGTALGIYGLWVLLPAESERQYEASVRKIHAA